MTARKSDIENRQDLEKLMHAFYAKAMQDPVIGHYFTEVVQLDLVTHIPRITDFWETIIFGVNRYHGDTFAVHAHLQEKCAFRDEHFNRWVQLFKETVDENFSGDKAETIRQRAESIATIMKIKLVYGGIHPKKSAP
ncbi:MAG TPA: group III truncated hemoglobin [Sediminibacterium sp.]|nr:group III truncated hemoglobin [Sediminibacterium sp.]